MHLPPPVDQRRDSTRDFYCVVLAGIAVSSRPWRNGVSGVEGWCGPDKRGLVTPGRRSTAFWEEEGRMVGGGEGEAEGREEGRRRWYSNLPVVQRVAASLVAR